MRTTIIKAIGAVLAVSSLSAQAQVLLENTSNATELLWTATDLNGNPPTVSTANAQLTGFFSGAGGFDGTENISLTAKGYSGWNSAAAKVAAEGNFTNYFNGLTSADIKTFGTPVRMLGIDDGDGNNKINTDEALVYEVDLSGLTTTDEIMISNIGLHLFGSGEAADYLIVSESGSVVTQAWTKNDGNNEDIDIQTLNWPLNDGDLLIIGGAAGDFRVANSIWDIEVEITDVIPPVGLEATASNSVVYLDWNDQDVDEFESFVVYRSLVDGGPYTLLESNVSVSAYTDNNVTNDVSYYYVAATVGTNTGQTGYSDQVAATPVVSVPTGLIKTNGNGSVELAWDASPDTQFEKYVVYRSVTSGSGYQVVNSNVLVNAYTDAAAANGVEYYYAISALDINGFESAKSADVLAAPTSDLVFVNLVNNQQASYYSLPIPGNATFSPDGADNLLGKIRAGNNAGEKLYRPVLAFPLSLDNVGGTTNGIVEAVLRVYLYKNSLSSSGPGSALHVYASQTMAADEEPNADPLLPPTAFEDTGFFYEGMIDGVVSNAAVGQWYEINVTDAVLSDLVNDPADATAGSVFRLQLNDDMTMATNDQFSVEFIDNAADYDDVSFASDRIPQLRIKYELNLGTTYAQWAASWGKDIGANTDDYDLDGVNNLYEFGLNGDPTNTAVTGTLPTFTYTGDGFEYIHGLRDDVALTYTVETKTDLTNGSWTNLGFTVSGTNMTGETLDFVTNSIDAELDQRFIRLLVEE